MIQDHSDDTDPARPGTMLNRAILASVLAVFGLAVGSYGWLWGAYCGGGESGECIGGGSWFGFTLVATGAAFVASAAWVLIAGRRTR